jgi:phosphate transport system protein
MMRANFHKQLDSLVDDLVRLTLTVEGSMIEATTALLDADAHLADRVIAGGPAASALRGAIDGRALDLAARQQPVAGDLRIVIAALRMTSDLERMEILSEHVAEVARRHAPNPVVPADLREIVQRMGSVAQRLTARTRQAITARDWRAADDFERADDEMDVLVESVHRRMLRDPWPHGTEAAIDMTLLGRYYERYADHAVSMAHHVAYLAGYELAGQPWR